MYVGCDWREVSVENGRAAIYNMATRIAFQNSDSVNFREMHLSDPIEYVHVCCCFSTRRLLAQNRDGQGWKKMTKRISLTCFTRTRNASFFRVCKRFVKKAALNPGHTSPYDFPHPALWREFLRTHDPERFSCLWCVWSHIRGRTAEPGENWRGAITRHPSTNRKCAGRCHTEASGACPMNTCAQGAGACPQNFFPNLHIHCTFYSGSY